MFSISLTNFEKGGGGVPLTRAKIIL